MANKSDETDRTGMIQVDLNEEDWKQRAENLARLENERTALEAKKATHNRKWNESLKQYDTDIKVAAEEVETRKAWVPAQSDMFGANDTSDEPAEEAPRGRRRRRGRSAEAAEGAGDAA